MRIALVDFDNLLVNVALMKLSAFHKAQGDIVTLHSSKSLPDPKAVDKVYVSTTFTWNRDAAANLQNLYPNIELGGTGWDFASTSKGLVRTSYSALPDAVEHLRPDYDLYKYEEIYNRIRGRMTNDSRVEKAHRIVDSGIGFLTRGCVRKCDFCIVPPKEGQLHRVANIADLINPRSNKVILLDNNLTASPDIIDILREVKDRKLAIDICQGIDIRLMTPEIAEALKGVKFFCDIHYAWDLMPFETQVLRGINMLAPFIGRKHHRCFMLVNYNTTWEEDWYRFHRLWHENKILPYVMYYNKHKMDKQDPVQVRLMHFQRWVNGLFLKKPGLEDFANYTNWQRAQVKLGIA